MRRCPATGRFAAFPAPVSAVGDAASFLSGVLFVPLLFFRRGLFLWLERVCMTVDCLPDPWAKGYFSREGLGVTTECLVETSVPEIRHVCTKSQALVIPLPCRRHRFKGGVGLPPGAHLLSPASRARVELSSNRWSLADDPQNTRPHKEVSSTPVGRKVYPVDLSLLCTV